MNELTEVAAKLRGEIIELSHRTQAPHLASSLSCMDIMVALYWEVLSIDPEQPEAPDRDRLLLSKGHAAPTLFACLAHQGFFPLDKLRDYNSPGQPLAEHPSPGDIPGVEAATGSLGHGLPLGLGMAFSAGRLEEDFNVYVVMSDGECNEGSNWEAAQLAPAKDLNNVTAIIDYNKWQATGRSQEVLQTVPLADKWEAFGWETQVINGHDISEILTAIKDGAASDKPAAIIAHTVKGKGVSFMEDDNNWHYRKPSAEEVEKAKQELGVG